MDFYVAADSKHIKKEREKAREMRRSGWWKQQLAKGTCYYCEGKFAVEDLTMDHIVPVARGGRSIESNLVVACKNCNNEKKHLTPAEMILKKLNNPS